MQTQSGVGLVGGESTGSSEVSPKSGGDGWLMVISRHAAETCFSFFDFFSRRSQSQSFSLIFTCARNASVETAERMARNPPGTSTQNIMFRCGFLCLTTCGIFFLFLFFFIRLCKHAHWPTLRFEQAVASGKKERKKTPLMQSAHALVHRGVAVEKNKKKCTIWLLTSAR